MESGMRVYERGRKDRILIIDVRSFGSISHRLPNRAIYVQCSKTEDGLNQLRASSYHPFESASNGDSSVFTDSNFVDGKKIMSRDGFITTLEVLNNCRVMDYSPKGTIESVA